MSEQKTTPCVHCASCRTCGNNTGTPCEDWNKRGEHSCYGWRPLLSECADLIESLNLDPKAYTVWRYHKAPEMLRALSNHGGDEDWLMVYAASNSEGMPTWADDGTSFGCCSVEGHAVGAWVVAIGAHA